VLEDVLADYEEVFGHSIVKDYLLATRPCLVVFTRPGDWHGATRAALNYVHRAVHGLGQSHSCNTNFSGHGSAVPPEWIDRIEWLNE
jgi:hypothetical protein